MGCEPKNRIKALVTVSGKTIDSPVPIPEIVPTETMPVAYQRGRQAFFKNESEDANPYDSSLGTQDNVDESNRRTQWFDGYFDARLDTKFKDMFKKYRIATMFAERKIAIFYGHYPRKN